jgi:hypothetical protein
VEIEAVELDLVCDVHGCTRVVSPVCLPWPSACPECATPAAKRLEVRRYRAPLPLVSRPGEARVPCSETFLG